MIALDVAYGELHWRLRQDPRVTVIERHNAALSRPSCPFAPDLVVADVSFISLTKVLGAGARRDRGPRSTASRWSSPSSRWAASGWARAAWCATPADRRGALVAVGAFARDELGLAVLRLRVVGPARARRATRRRFVWIAEPGREGAVEDLEAAARRVEP